MDYPDSCAHCATLLAARFGRRRFLQASAAGLATLVAGPAWAKPGYDAMVLSCIDPRFHEPVRKYVRARKLTGKHSQFVVAGAAIGVVAPAFKDWHKTFWDNLGASVQLHRIRRVIAINHRDCGAARIAYGDASVAGIDAETATHRASLEEFRRQMAVRHPELAVDTGLMALDGLLQKLG